MAKIITVTLNTAIDLLIEVEGLTDRDNLLAKRSCEFACGKGINVAKAVESLGCPVSCLGFVGHHSTGLFEALKSGLLCVDLIEVEGKTRTNITLTDLASGRETHIRTAGYRVTEGDFDRLIEKFDRYVQSGDIVIFSGSLPPGAKTDCYRNLIEICRRKAAIPFLDSSGPSLSHGIKAGPALIKPNLQELEDVTGCSLTSRQALVEAARAIIGQGVERVFVSLGAEGLIAVDASLALSACVARKSQKTATQIGCGDAMIAGLAVAMMRQLPFEEMARWGVACGTANLISSEPGRIVADDVCKIFNYLQINPLG